MNSNPETRRPETRVLREDGSVSNFYRRAPVRPGRIHEPTRGRRPMPGRRARFANVWITKPILRTRGWTDTAIRDFLPNPERHCDNPHPEGGRRPMPLWRAETIARAESTPEWQTWLEKSLHRRHKTLRGLTAAIRDPAFRRRAKAADTAITAHRFRR